MVYAINYDLRKLGQDYAEFYEAIKALGAWHHYLESMWLVDTQLSAEDIWNRLRPHVDTNDYFLVIGVTGDYAGWLPQEASNWMKEHI